MKRFLLINPPTGNYIREDRCQMPVRGLTSSARMPLDLAYMASGVESVGGQALIKDYPAEKKTEKDLLIDLENFQPDCVVINSVIPTLGKDIQLADKIKQQLPNIKVIFKGAQFAVQAEAEELLKQSSKIDIVIRHESELTLKDIVTNKLSDVLGISYREDGNIISNLDRPFLENLDLLGLPARHLIDNKLYIRPDTGEKQTSILINRGCPGNCSFCLVKIVSGQKINQRSVESVIEEIKECLDKYQIKNFYLRADTFTWQRSWVENFCQQIIQNKLAINWSCNSRVDTFDLELAELMKKAGCWIVGFGLESGSQALLDQMNKKITLEQAQKAINVCHQVGLKSYMFFLYGLPEETTETLAQTLNLAKELDGDFVEFHHVYPFPGTDFYNYGLANKLFVKKDLIGSDIFSSPVASFQLSSQELQKFRKKAVRSFYLRPKYILKSLKNLNKPKTFVNYLKKGLSVLFNL